MVLRVSHVMLAKGFGGAERHFVDLSIELAKRGLGVQAICHRRFTNQASLLGEKNLRLNTVSVRGWWDLVAAWRIGQLIKEFQPDIVHAHLARGAYLAGKVTRRLELPLVVNTHNYVDLKYYRNVDHFVVPTEDQHNYLMSHSVARNKIITIPHFSPADAAEANNLSRSLTFASYGRFVPKKGFDILIRAFGMTLERDIDARLLIGGDGPERESLQRLVVDLGLGSKVEFSGWVEDVPEFLRRADIFVLPSLDEPFGIVVLEAMANQIPVIATRTQGPTEILDDDTAYLVNIADPRALSEAMQFAADDPDGRTERAGKASKRFKRTYSSEAVVPQYVEVYRRFAPQTGQDID